MYPSNNLILPALKSKLISFSSCLLQTGQYRIQDLDKVMTSLQKQYGKIAKVGGLIGHPDLLFVFDGDEIRKVFKREEVLPHRYNNNEMSVLHRISVASIFNHPKIFFLFCLIFVDLRCRRYIITKHICVKNFSATQPASLECNDIS